VVDSKITPGKASFGPYEANIKSGELRKHGLRIRLQEKPFQLLALLVTEPGAVITREAIKGALWPPGTHVDFEHSLNTTVNKLRQALHDRAAQPRYIETIARRGYRFIAPVELTAPGPASRQKIMLAVLPFSNLSGDREQEYFSDGLTEELLTQLARLHPQRLGIIARTSIMRYKNTEKDVRNIGSELGVEYILEGSVRRAGDKIRITTQLIAVKDQTHLWAESYDRELADVFTIQSEVAENVARSLVLEFFPAEASIPAKTLTTDPETHELFLRACHHWNARTPEGLRKAFDYLQQSLVKDPNFAAAYARLADAFNISVDYGLLPPAEAFPQAQAAAGKALELNDKLAQPHAAMAFIQHRFDWDWAAAETEYQKAINLNPNYATAHHWYAEFLSQMGRHDDALQRIGKARQLDPLSFIILSVEAWLLYHARRYDQAVRKCREVYDLDPDFPVARYILGRVLLQQGKLKNAMEESQQAATHSKNNPFMLSAWGLACAATRKKKQARGILERLAALSENQYVSPYLKAKIHLGLEEENVALDLIESACEERDGWLADLHVDPELDSLRPHPRFQKLLQRMNFPV
jgi:TolB-like protein/Tfp pilus assembly protein PilF